MTSEDVKFTLLEVSSKFGSKFVAPGKAIKEIETPDPRTVVISLSKPFGPVPVLAGLRAERGHPAGARLSRQRHPEEPGVLTHAHQRRGHSRSLEWVRGDHLTLVRNPNYWTQGQPYLDRIIIKIIPDASARLLALQAGEVDYIDQYYFPLSAHDILAKDPRFSLKEVSYPSVDLIILNTRKPPLDQAKVRQALLTAIDRNYLLQERVSGDGAGRTQHHRYAAGWAYNPAVDYEKLYPYDAKRAAALLDEAGLKPGPDGTRFTLRLSFDTGRPEYTSLAQALQRYWQAVGIKTVLEGAERPVVLKRVYSDYDFDATLQNYSTSGDPALGISRTYHTEAIKQGQSFNNATRYSNPEVDALFDKGRDASTEEERKAHYFKVQEVLARDLPVLTIHQQAQIGVSRRAAAQSMEGGELSMVASDMAGAVTSSRTQRVDATAGTLVERAAGYWSAARYEDVTARGGAPRQALPAGYAGRGHRRLAAATSSRSPSRPRAPGTEGTSGSAVLWGAAIRPAGGAGRARQRHGLACARARRFRRLRPFGRGRHPGGLALAGTRRRVGTRRAHGDCSPATTLPRACWKAPAATAPHNDLGWHSTGTCGSFGAAAAAARILKLDARTLRRRARHRRHLHRRHLGVPGRRRHDQALPSGQGGRERLSAALLAQAGMTGPRQVLGGEVGRLLFHLQPRDRHARGDAGRPRQGVPHRPLRHEALCLLPRPARRHRRAACRSCRRRASTPATSAA